MCLLESVLDLWEKLGFSKAISSYIRKENVNKKESVPGVQNIMVKSC